MAPVGRKRRFTWGWLTALSGTVAVGVATLTHQPAWAAVLATARFRLLGAGAAYVAASAGLEVVLGGVAGRGRLADRERKPGGILEGAHTGTQSAGVVHMGTALPLDRIDMTGCFRPAADAGGRGRTSPCILLPRPTTPLRWAR